jgi:PGF-pre-PGF domain-containing protein
MRQIIFLVLLGLVLISVGYSQSVGIGVSLTLTGESCYDGLQDQNETGIDCGGTCDACQVPAQQGNGRGSGGGSGGTANAPQNQENEFKKNYFFLKESVSEKISRPDIAVSEIDIKLSESRNNVTLIITNLGDDIKIIKQNKSTLTYEYFKIEALNLKPDDIVQVNLEIKIPKIWVKEKNKSLEDFTLLAYRGEWQDIETKYARQDGEYYYFEASVNNLGYFVIVGKEASAKKIIAEEKETQISKAIQIIENPENFKLLNSVERIEIIILSVSLTLLICLGIFHIYKRIWVTDKKEEEKLEEELKEEKKD